MNRPNTKKTVFNDEKPYKINPKYVYDLEKYCDELEQSNKSLSNAYDDCLVTLHFWEEEYYKCRKALDKTCETLADMKNACDCYEFETCPFREKCPEGTNYCYDRDKWKEWAMKDLINDRDE